MNQTLNVHSPLTEDVETLVRRAIGCCITVHRTLGPGLPEKIYVRALRLELAAQQIAVDCERRIEISYRGESVGILRVDLIAGDHVVIEVKAVEQLADVHHRQLLTYMRAAQLRVGLLVNFNVAMLRDGLSRKVL